MTVNDQILDSVQSVRQFTLNDAGSQTLAMLNAAMTESLGIGMFNAVVAQNNAQMMSSAATTSTCARLLSALPAPPPPSPAPTPSPAPAPSPAPTPSPSPAPAPTPAPSPKS